MYTCAPPSFRVRAISAKAFAGRNIQGIVFTPDGKYLVVQNYVEKELAFYRVTPRGPEDTGQRMPIPGYPAGLRTATWMCASCEKPAPG